MFESKTIDLSLPLGQFCTKQSAESGHDFVPLDFHDNASPMTPASPRSLYCRRCARVVELPRPK